ncbi:MAG TPA: right-handed parallel beta-helix repeat-containing protein [Tepidisphaeraceae bacterium]|nr:right-handed parallel beta-helix repeat-containing protein [Tepidisphaeraceae bacterium]
MTKALERLEPRTHLSVSQDADGWTTVMPSADTRTIFVSSSIGSDRNDGLSPNRPVKTLARGYSRLRDGRPDHLLLRTGDVWDERFPRWRLSGRSADEPIVIGKYGPRAKPLIRAGAKTAFSTGEGGVNHLAIFGLHLVAHTRDPYDPVHYTGTAGGDGMAFWGDVHDLLIEDVTVDQFTKNIVFSASNGRTSNVRIRRSIITDAYNGSGVYAGGVDGLLVEGNVFDHNGWNEIVDIPEQRIDHNLYIQSNTTGVVVQDNIFADGGMHGLQARSGGIIRNNLFVRNAIGMTFGVVSGASSYPGGVGGEVSGNVFLGGRDVRGAVLGWGIEIGNTRDGGGTLVRDNIIAHDMTHRFAAIRLNQGHTIHNPEQTVGLHDVRVVGNIVYNWHRGLSTTSRFVNGGTGVASYSGVLVKNNDFQNISSGRIIDHPHALDLDLERWEGNRYFSSADDIDFRAGNKEHRYPAWQRLIDPTSAFKQVDYFAPDRTVESYSVSLGHRNRVGALLSEMRHQSRDYWRDAYSTSAVMAYLREGFRAVKGPPRLLATNLSHKNLDSARQRITFWFSRDVSESIDVGDLKVWSRAGDRVIRTSETAMTYDPLTHSATWTFPGMRRNLLWAGDWAVHLHAPGIRADGQALDTDWDGKGGDSYRLKFTLEPRV